MRSRSSAAAFVVKVRPSTCPGSTRPEATRWTTRAAITEVFPEPAPATTSAGSSGAEIATHCCSLTTYGVCISCCSVSGDGLSGHLIGRTPSRSPSPGRSP